MNKIFVKVHDNKLLFSYKRKVSKEQKDLMNTSVIGQNELVFTESFIKESPSIVFNFIMQVSNSFNIDTVMVKELEILPLVLDLIAKAEHITYLEVIEEAPLSYKICEQIQAIKHLKYLTCYNVPTYLLEMLDKVGIKVTTNGEMFFSSSFMTDNNLYRFADLYYAKEINVNLPFSIADEEDFMAFLSINKYLKRMNLNKIYKSDIDYIMLLFEMYKIKNVKVYIKDNIKDARLAEHIRKINKLNKKNKIRFEIDYSKDYIQKNLASQIRVNAIRVCTLVIVCLITMTLSKEVFNNFSSAYKISELQSEINDLVNQTTDVTGSEGFESATPQVTLGEQSSSVPNAIENATPIRNLNNLLTMNEDTVGWIKVNQTQIDYPVVQADDNEYYLDKNFKKQKDIAGWLFLDYRNDPVNLDKNNIIYGHNVYYNGAMFGSLKNTKKESWYTNPENLLIEFETMYKNMKWKVFSVYEIPVTSDYLVVDFLSDNHFREFINTIQSRSIYDFGVTIDADDKIITLSTCTGDNSENRLVLHAVLVE